MKKIFYHEQVKHSKITYNKYVCLYLQILLNRLVADSDVSPSRKKILVTKNIGIEAKENFKNNCKD